MTHAKVASVAPSMMMEGAAPSVASQSSLTNEAHMRIISTGDNAMSTMPTSFARACSGFCSARDSTMCCSAMSRTAMRLRMAASRKLLICSEDMYLAHSWNLPKRRRQRRRTSNINIIYIYIYISISSFLWREKREGDKLTLSPSSGCRSRGPVRDSPAAQQTPRFPPNSSPAGTSRSTRSFS